MKQIEEELFLNKIRTKVDFEPWLEKAKRSIIQANKLYRIKHEIELPTKKAKKTNL
jgi:hypothetical protein